MKKVLHLLSSNKYSGAENVACYIIQNLPKDGYLSYYASPDGPIREYLEHKNIEYIAIKKRNIFSIKNVIKKINPDIIHAHDYTSSILAALSNFKGKIFFHIHKTDLKVSKKTFKARAFLLASKKACHIFWVSKESFEGFAYKNKIAAKSSILINVVDSKSILANSNKEISSIKDIKTDAIYVGRLTGLKNPLRLISIAELVSKNQKKFVLGIVGDGELKEKMFELVKEKNLSNNVKFFGKQNNPFPFINSSKMVLLTSIYEGMPMVALEAFCLHKPIICTPVGGLKTLVVNEYNGYTESDNNEFANKIVSLIKEESIRHKMEDNAYSTFCSYNDEQKYIEQLVNAYEK